MEFRAAGFLRLLVLAGLLNCLSQAIHEAGHWAVYQAFGRGPVWGFTGLVQIWGKPPLHPGEWVATTAPDGEQGWLHLTSTPGSKAEAVMALAAGPVVSLLSVVGGLWRARLGKRAETRQIGLLLALIGSFVASMYYIRSPLRSGGDESLMAAHLGLPRYAVELPLALAFIACFILGLRAFGNWRTGLKWTSAILLGSVPTGLLLMKADGLVRSQVNLGNPLFQPVFGFSLPVVLVNGIVLLGLWIWVLRARNHSRGHSL